MDELNDVKPKKVNIAKYEIFRTIGTGTFGRVKLGKLKNTDKYVAIKYKPMLHGGLLR